MSEQHPVLRASERKEFWKQAYIAAIQADSANPSEVADQAVRDLSESTWKSEETEDTMSAQGTWEDDDIPTVAVTTTKSGNMVKFEV